MVRSLCVFIAAAFCGCVVLGLAFSSPAAANSKYAALVIDADRGTVLYAANANSKRYPASLTKMMTLYMTFEALEEKRLRLDSRLRVSKKAAGMPQTNIGLKKGETIKVRDIIGSLIVRSANDSAVVIAEALGKSEYGFAKLMTAKARKLGMKNTVFRNASGLPDRKQKSTARDIAVLALALKKHFPQYFHFFRTSKFRYKGKAYKSHNKVMKRYPGADGIKTGYIRASGFNLVTSVQRNGRTLIAVVMGGKTSRRRDNHMIDLLDRSFAKLKKMGAFAVIQKKTLPVPVPKPRLESKIAKAVISPVPSKPKISKNPPVTNKNIKKVIKEVAIETPKSKSPAATKKVVKESKNGGQFAPSPVPKPRTAAILAAAPKDKLSAASGFSTARQIMYKDWGIQVGAFDQKEAAYDAVKRAVGTAKSELSHSRASISNVPGKKFGQVVYRARIANLTELQARKACKALLANQSSCFIFQVKNASDL